MDTHPDKTTSDRTVPASAPGSGSHATTAQLPAGGVVRLGSPEPALKQQGD